MQYAAEVTFPTPEGTSNGLVQLSGQCSVVFVFIMGPLRTGSGSFAVSLLLMSALLAVTAVVVSRLKDAPIRVSASSDPQLASAPASGPAGPALAVSAAPDAPRPPAPIG